MLIGFRDLMLMDELIESGARDTQDAIAAIVAEFSGANVDHAGKILEPPNDRVAAQSKRQCDLIGGEVFFGGFYSD